MMDLEEPEWEEALSFLDIYQKLLEYEELILTIPEDQEQALRKGLAWTKAKQNAKIRSAGLQPDATTLQFNQVTGAGEGQIKLHIVLAKKKAPVTVLNIELPDSSL